VTGALQLFVETGQDVLELGDRAERRCGDGQLDFRAGSGPHQHGGVAIAVLAEAFAGICKVEPTNAGDDDVAPAAEAAPA
jgi:hypothetical protein